MPVAIASRAARKVWLQAQGLDEAAPFGTGREATRAAVQHLGYVQIDTINVIERCHHHILWTRIPDYRRAHLHDALSVDKSVFEYWTHALSFVPSADYRYFRASMAHHRRAPPRWDTSVTLAEMRKLLKRIRDDGPLTIRDIDDDVLVDKDHPWASRKPSKRALQLGFYTGALTISARSGMLKTYELTDRHFGWDAPPRAATELQTTVYRLDRALRSQGIVSLDSVCHLEAARKPAVRLAIEARVRRKALVPVTVEGAGAVEHWAEPHSLEGLAGPDPARLVHILSPFDPLVIQRKRLRQFFGYEHRFEAYLPQEKRVYGYFALPVLVGDNVVAAIDLKTDRRARALLIQRWTWVGEGAEAVHKSAIEEALHRFEALQLHD